MNASPTAPRVKIKRIAAAAIASGLGIALAACSPGGSGDPADQTFDLTWSSYVPPGTYLSLAMDEWIRIVEEESEGRVSIEPFYMGALCQTLDGLACIKDGRADIAYTSPAFHPAEFPLANVSTVPFVTEDPLAQTIVSRDLYLEDDDFRAEFDAQQARLLYFVPVGESILGTKELVTDFDQLAGKSVRGTARMLNALESANANPVAIPVNEMYEAIERGVIDAWAATDLDAGLINNNMGEVTPFMAETGSGAFINVVAVVSQSRWDSFPEDIQQIMQRASEDVFDRLLGEYRTQIDEIACGIAVEQDVTLTIWSDAEKQKWRDAVGDSLKDSWVNDARNSGVDLDLFFADWEQRLAAAEQISGYVSPISLCLSR